LPIAVRRRSTASIRIVVLSGFVAVGTAFIACLDEPDCGDEQSPPQGWFEDTRRPRICPSDTVILTPDLVQIGPAFGTSDGGAGGNTTDAEVVAMDGDGGTTSSSGVFTVLVRRANGEPHEKAHVDVRLCSGGGAVQLVPTNRADLPRDCKVRSSGFLECTLDTSGAASFEARAVKQSGVERICVYTGQAGPNDRASATATVEIGPRMAPLDGVDFDVDSNAALVSAPTSMACNGAPAGGCVSWTARSVRLHSKKTDIVPPRDGGGVGFVDGGYAAPDGPATANLTVIPGAGSTSWLSKANDCQNRSASLPVHFDGTSFNSESVYLCTDGAGGSARLVATFTPRLTSWPSSAATEVSLFGVPALLETASVSPTRYRFTARDCRNTAIAGTKLTFGGGAVVDTGPTGTVEADVAPADAGTILVQAAHPNIPNSGSTCGLAIGGGQ